MCRLVLCAGYGANFAGFGEKRASMKEYWGLVATIDITSRAI